MTAGSRLRNVLLFLVFLLLVNIVTIEAGSGESKVTVANMTDHYLHIVIEGNSFLYVAPRRSVTYVTGATPEVYIEVFYAPGQQIQGSLTGVVEVPYVSASRGCTCRDSQYGDCMYEPAVGGSIRIEIDPAMLEPGDGENGEEAAWMVGDSS